MKHEFNNQSSQAERKAIVKNDSYFLRQQSNVDDAGGRYAKLTPTNVIGSTAPQYPQLPASSPWALGFDQNLEPPLCLDVNAQEAVGNENEIQSSLLALNPTPATATPTEVGDRAEEEPVIGSTVALLAAMDEPVIGSSTSFKRRF